MIASWQCTGSRAGMHGLATSKPNDVNTPRAYISSPLEERDLTAFLFTSTPRILSQPVFPFTATSSPHLPDGVDQARSSPERRSTLHLHQAPAPLVRAVHAALAIPYPSAAKKHDGRSFRCGPRSLVRKSIWLENDRVEMGPRVLVVFFVPRRRDLIPTPDVRGR